MEHHQIIISRANSLIGCGIKYGVEIDGIYVGFLKNGETIDIPTEPGSHIISFLRGRKIEKEISFRIPKEQEITAFSFKINANGKPEITRDNRGGIEEFSSYPNKVQKKRSKMAIALAVTFIFVYLVITFGEDASPSTSQNEYVAPQEGLTDEEKAVNLLNEATENFLDGKYMSAISVCDQISAEFPETETASNIKEYLSEQFAQFPHFSASELMRAYDENIVNADEQYTDTIMVVSGTVSSIGKTNGDTNLTVLLESGTYFYGVQLNFDTSQTDSIATLSEGDNVTAIGKCTGKSGKLLLVIDGNNVMIENCYIIK